METPCNLNQIYFFFKRNIKYLKKFIIEKKVANNYKFYTYKKYNY